MRIISTISKANPGVVTTTQAHGYLDNLFVRIVLPGNFGMNQVNGQVYRITVLSDTTFSLNSDTSKFDSYSVITTSQSPQVIPVGETADTLANREENTLTPIGG
jgi:hypothetical protein